MLEEPSLANLTTSNYAKPSKTQNPILQQLGQPHIDSFNYMTNYGLKLALKNLAPIEFQLNEHRLKFEIVKIDLLHPQVPPGHVGVRDHKIYPTECRQRAASYKGRLIGQIQWFVDDVQQAHFEKDFGQIPIMIKSNRCNLENLSPQELVEHKEHEQEWGGYFIIKGHERLMRMLLQTRRNYPIAIKRSTWKQKGTLFSENGVSIRCVGEDQISCTNILHFVTDGTVKLMFGYKKFPYYLPLLLVLKCLCDYRDSYIYQKLINGYEDNSYYKESIKTMLLNLIKEDLKTHDDCCRYLGKMFRVKFTELPEWKTDQEICDYLLKNCLLLHLNNNVDKFNLLVIMTQKLFLLLDDKIKVEGADAVMMQEILLGGHLYLQTIKERLHLWLVRLRQMIMKKFTEKAAQLNQNEILLLAKRCGSLESGLDNFFATGNLASPSGLNLMQTSGLTIVCENINRMRYMSHFRAVHRGSFFQEMRTTDVRQLLPDAWGFICPVHTPDGAPCGLLNHLTMDCIITDFIADRRLIKNIPQILANLGMIDKDDILIDYKTCYCCLLDGCLIGYIPESLIDSLVWKLREFKIDNQQIPNTLEIVWIKKKKFATQLPGLYLFAGPARMMRPVLNLRYKKVELIGTFEQVYLDICVNLNEFYENTTTHMELNKTAFLSNLAKLIPMPDCNQSPRNMYQCQMGKQTMGTACHTYNLQSETKLYRLQTPATPLFRPVHYDHIDLDDFAMGTNAIVAVISYTGYDMEDAMIINKSSHDRGFAHGSIYKSEFVELEQDDAYFHRNPDRPELAEYLDTDGLPFIGRQIHVHEPYYCYYNTDEGCYTVKLFSGKEDCIVDNVRLCGAFDTQPKCVCITFRIQRNPNVGDKFASRAGQKGICSQLWQQEDLPFTETGLVPDIVFNPHGFPSRMTIAMMIELMAGKSAALHGLVHDATPFKFNENDTAIDYFGRCLEAGGYNYYGTETMYSGIDGRQMTVDIFFGVVHYQRLRHMVSDKWQVRSTGPIDILTRQPLKGRRRGGGVRFGEMERDSLISHGASFLLQDRLFHCSDKVTAFICTSCKTLLGPMTLVTRVADKPHLTSYKEHCRLCGHGHNIEEIQIPYIFKFFVTQLAAININVKIACERI